MPKRIPVLPDSLVLSASRDLDPALPLTPAQVSQLTGLSEGQLKERRRQPQMPPIPIPTEKAGSFIWYTLGEVLRYRKIRAGEPASDAPVLSFTSFPDFLNHAAADDWWPFAVRDGKPMDAIADLGTLVSDDHSSVWLTLSDYLSLRLRVAQSEAAAITAAALDGALAAVSASIGQRSVCARGCGKAEHPGRPCRL